MSPPAHRRAPARRGAVIAAVTTAVGLLMACSPGSGTTGTPSTSTLPPFEAVFVDGDCAFKVPPDSEVTCGTLTVALDRADPTGPTIDLAVARLHAENGDPRPDPVLYLEGGPGGSGLETIGWWPGTHFTADRDVILFDQRGVGASRPQLTCDREYDDYDDYKSDLELYHACHGRLDGRTDLDRYTTVDAADDVADLLAALEIDSVNLYGTSYGSRLALLVAGRHPDGIRSLTLEGVYPPGVEALEDQASNAWGAFDALFTACETDDRCDDAYPEIRDRFLGLVEDLNDRPARVRDGGESQIVTGDDVADALWDALYDSTVIPDIPYAIELIEDDDISAAFDLLTGGFGTSFGTDNDGAYYSVTCSEEPPANDLDDMPAAGDDVPDVLDDVLTGPADFDFAVCEVWGVADEPIDQVTTDIPTLLLSGALDPITPPRWGDAAAATLSRSWHVVFPGMGHGVLGLSSCADTLARTFLDHPDTGPDLLCAGRQTAPRFRTS